MKLRIFFLLFSIIFFPPFKRVRKLEGEGFSYVLGVLRKADNTLTQPPIQIASLHAGQQEQLQFSWPGILYTSEYVTEQRQRAVSVRTLRFLLLCLVYFAANMLCNFLENLLCGVVWGFLLLNFYSVGSY